MISALIKTLTLFRERSFWGIIWRSLALTSATFAGLLILVWGGLAYAPITDLWWLNTVLEVLGGLAVVVLAWLLFPAVAGMVISGFLDRIVVAVEARYYPHLPAPTPVAFWPSLRVALQFTAVMVFLNLLVLPLYLVPVVNLLAFYGINGYLLGREYFELVSLRHLDVRAAQQLRQAHPVRLFVAGLLIAGLLTVPLVNLLAPLIAAAFMVHLVVSLADFAPRSDQVFGQP